MSTGFSVATTKRAVAKSTNVTLPSKFFGGNKFHSKASNWDPFQATVLKTLPAESIKYRRGTGRPKNASKGLTEYSVQLHNSTENLNLVDHPIVNMKKVGLKKLA